MQSSIKERLKYYLRVNRITQENFGNAVGVAPTYVSSIRKSIQPDKLARIQQVYPDLNIEWLVTGRGEMINTSRAITMTNSGNITGNGNNVNVVGFGGSPNNSDAEMMEVEELPVIPSNIVNAPNIDVLEYINMNSTNMQPVVRQFPEAVAFYKIKSKAMEDKICAGDILAITPYPQGEEHIVPGDPYVVDTNTNGLITRRLFEHPDGYIARSNKPEEYPEFIILREHIIRVYRIVGLLRQNVI